MGVKLIHVPGNVTLAELKSRVTGGRIVKIGFPSGSSEKDGTPSALVGAVHEFGSVARGIPERSYLRSTMNEQMNKYVAMNKKSLQRVVNGATSMRLALELLGQVASGDVKKKIRSGPFTPLSQGTIDRKGSDRPLIDTGDMLKNVTYELD